jgi:hypothetical protein
VVSGAFFFAGGQPHFDFRGTSGVSSVSDSVSLAVHFHLIFFEDAGIVANRSSRFSGTFVFAGGWPRLGFGGPWMASALSSPLDVMLSVV